MSTLPTSLRHSLTLWLSDDPGNNLMEFQAALPEIADKPLSLLYEPATQADIDLIRAAAPADVSLARNSSSLLPAIMQRIPAQIVSVRPVLLVNGQKAAASNPIRMGNRLT